MSTDRLAVARILDQIAGHLEFKDENPFRVRAFRNAARAVVQLPTSVEEALANGSLAATRGIGPATLAIVREVMETGSARYLAELRQEVPAGLLEMADIPGLGLKRVRVAYQTLGIDSLEKLEAAARDGRLARAPGFGAKTAEKILKGIRFVRGTRTFQLWHPAAREAEVIRDALAAIAGVKQVAVAGAVRRCLEVVGELVLVVDLGEGAARDFFETVRSLPGLSLAAPDPDTGVLGFRTIGGTAGRIFATGSASFGTALIRGTGNEAHLALLEGVAKSQGLWFEGSVLRRGKAVLNTPTEAEAYDLIGLSWIPSELREGLDEVELAGNRALPRLLERSDLAGLLHCHSTWSDGRNSIAELAAGCGRAGYEWLGLSDHSQTAAYAGGLPPEEVRRQWEEIRDLPQAPGAARVLRGIESDILRDGRLDYDADTLSGFDFVIGSVHSRMGMEEAEMTERLLRALEQPGLTVLGHPTGRLLLAREPFKADWEPVFARAAERRVALEINGDPNRMDLDWRLVRRARQLGVPIALGADAHGLDSLSYQENALAMARKAGLTRDEVLNTGPAEAFLAFARARR